jgi:hypothetical protein
MRPPKYMRPPKCHRRAIEHVVVNCAKARLAGSPARRPHKIGQSLCGADDRLEVLGSRAHPSFKRCVSFRNHRPGRVRRWLVPCSMNACNTVVLKLQEDHRGPWYSALDVGHSVADHYPAGDLLAVNCQIWSLSPFCPGQGILAARFCGYSHPLQEETTAPDV